jgi:flagellar biosynthesis protein FlhG
VLLRKTSASLLANYALIKAMIRQFAIRQFSIVVSGVESEDEARTVFENIAAAARRYLAVSLRYLGYIPNDEELARADTLSTCVVDAFPTAPAAVAFRELARALMGDFSAQAALREDEPFPEVMKFAD